MSDGQHDPFWMDPSEANDEGLVGVGGDLAPATLLRAYGSGVFPWYNDGDPILWWSPDPRSIFEMDGFHCSRSLAKTMRSGKFRHSYDRCFGAVMQACGATRPEGTWVTDDMVTAYVRLHELGHAHSVETWVKCADADDEWELAGGVYGIGIGGFFAAESMFHYVSDAGKVALLLLADRLRSKGFTLVDTQMRTEHTTKMGAVDIPRDEYLRRLRRAIADTDVRF